MKQVQHIGATPSSQPALGLEWGAGEVKSLPDDVAALLTGTTANPFVLVTQAAPDAPVEAVVEEPAPSGEGA